MTEVRERAKKTIASLIILSCLTLQAIATFGAIQKLGWPFINYPMYSGPPRYEGDVINNRYFIFGTLEDSTEVPILAQDLHLHFHELLWGPVEDMLKGRIESLYGYVQLYESRYHRRLTSLRLENHPLVLKRNRVVEEPIQVVKIVHLDARGSGTK